MLNSVTVNGYRGFANFKLSNLGRVNLLVGKNNCGKSAMLEAVELLVSTDNHVRRLWRSLTRRGEELSLGIERSTIEPELSHLFYGHEIKPGSQFKISGGTSDGKKEFLCQIVESRPEHNRLFEEANAEEDVDLTGSFALQVMSSECVNQAIFPISSRGTLNPRILRTYFAQTSEEQNAVVFIPTESLSSSYIGTFWGEFALNPEEHLVLDALRLLEPKIEGVAWVGTSRPARMGYRGGMVVKFNGAEKRIPMGSLGDGIWRIFGLILALIRSRDGVLLVDEIDTGLHYSVMTDMWRMVLDTAKRLDIQVFATTHSYDCLSSLARVSSGQAGDVVTLQRIEAGKEAGVAFTEEELRIAAERQIEVR